MKRVILLLPLLVFAFFVSVDVQAQAPGMFNFQAVARDATGKYITGPITVRITVSDGVNTYQETHPPVTPNSYGLFTVNIGAGTSTSLKTLAQLNWATSSVNVTVEVNPGTGFVTIGSNKQLLSVPYALYANSAGNSTGGATNNILNGTINPTTEGIAGDFYINTSTNVIFGPKLATGWPTTGISMVGTGTGSKKNFTQGKGIRIDSTGNTITITNTAVVDSLKYLKIGVLGNPTQAGQILLWNGTAWTYSAAPSNLNPKTDVDSTNDVTKTTDFNGDVTGKFDNLIIKDGAITDLKLDSIRYGKISKGTAVNGQVLKLVNGQWVASQDQVGAPGGGIKLLNGSTQSAQIFSLDTTTTNFDIISDTAQGQHVIHIPTIGKTGVARGVLSLSDYNLFKAGIGTASKPNVGAGLVIGNGNKITLKIGNSLDTSLGYLRVRRVDSIDFGAGKENLILKVKNGKLTFVADTAYLKGGGSGTNYTIGSSLLLKTGNILVADSNKAIWNANKLLGKPITKPVGGQYLSYDALKDSIIFVPAPSGTSQWIPYTGTGIGVNGGIEYTGEVYIDDTLDVLNVIKTSQVRTTSLNATGDINGKNITANQLVTLDSVRTPAITITGGSPKKGAVLTATDDNGHSAWLVPGTSAGWVKYKVGKGLNLLADTTLEADSSKAIWNANKLSGIPLVGIPVSPTDDNKILKFKNGNWVLANDSSGVGTFKPCTGISGIFNSATGSYGSGSGNVQINVGDRSTLNSGTPFNFSKQDGTNTFTATYQGFSGASSQFTITGVGIGASISLTNGEALCYVDPSATTVGDDWGVQKVVTDLTLKGDGAATPLGIQSSSIDSTKIKKRSLALIGLAADGAVNDQVLTYDAATGSWKPKAGGSSSGVSYIKGTGILNLTGNHINVDSSKAIWNAGQIQTKPVSVVAPTAGQVLKYKAGQWIPSSDSTGGSGVSYLKGTGILDFTGSHINVDSSKAIWNASQIQTKPVSAVTPTAGQVLKYKAGQWVPSPDSVATITGTSYTAGRGMTLNGTVFEADSNVAIWNAGQIQAKPVSAVAPTAGQVLKYKAGQWVPSPDSTGGSGVSYLKGTGILDLAGNHINVDSSKAIWNASQIQTKPVSAVAPTAGQVLKYKAGQWVPSPDSVATITGTSYTAGRGMTLNGTVFEADSNVAIWNAGQIQTKPVSAVVPTAGQVLKYKAGQWVPSPDSTGGSGVTYLKGTGILDLTGNHINVDSSKAIWNANKILGLSIGGTPGNGKVLRMQGGVLTFLTDSTGGSGTTYLKGTGILNFTGNHINVDSSKAIWNANQIQTKPVSAVAPTAGQVLKFKSGQWVPSPDSVATITGTSYTAGRGMTLNGTVFEADSNVAIWNAGQIQAKPVSAVAPTAGQVLKYKAGQWIPSSDSTGGSGTAYLKGTGILDLTGNHINVDSSKAIWNANKILGLSIGGTPGNGKVLRMQGGVLTFLTDSTGGSGTTYLKGTGILNFTGNHINVDSSKAIWNANQIQTKPVSAVAPTAGQVLKFKSGQWVPSPDSVATITGTSYTAGRGMTLNGTVFEADSNVAIWNAGQIQAKPVSAVAPTAGQVLKYKAGQWIPSSDSTGGSGTAYLKGTGILDLAGNHINVDSSKAIWNANKILGLNIAGTPGNGKVLRMQGGVLTFLTDSTGGSGTTYLKGTGILNLTGNHINVDSSKAIWNANQIQTKPVSAVAPTAGQVLKYKAGQWVPSSDSTGGSGTAYLKGTGILDLAGNHINVDSSKAIWNANKILGLSIGGTPGNGKVLRMQGGVLTFLTDSTGGSGTTYLKGTGILNFTGNHINVDSSKAIWNASQIQTKPVSAVAPTAGQVLKYKAGQWVPSSDSTGGSGTAYLKGTGILDLAGNHINVDSSKAIWNANKILGLSIGGTPGNGKVLRMQGGVLTFLTDSTGSGITYLKGTGILNFTGNHINVDSSKAIWNANQIQTKPVSAVAPTAGQVLKYKAGQWIASSDSTGAGVTYLKGTGVKNLNSNKINVDSSHAIWDAGSIGNNLVDTTTILTNTTADINKILKWNGTRWVAGAGAAAATLQSAYLNGDSILISANDSLTFKNSAGTVDLFTINSAGRVAIGGKTFSNATLAVYGNMITGNLSAPSDIRYKKNVSQIGSALETVQKLTGVSYNWRRDEFPQMNFMEGKDLGLIAQEVEKVLPELVMTDDKGFKTVRYTQLIPVLLEAIKEQQKQIEVLKTEVSAKDSKVQSSESRIQSLESSMKTLNSQMQLLMEVMGSKDGVKASK